MEEGGGGVVLEERLQEHANSAKDTDKDKDPEEQAVDHHGNVLPVFSHLDGGDGDPGVSDRCGMGVGMGLRIYTPHSSSSVTPM